MCGRYAVKKSTLIIANSLVKKNINVDLDQDNFNCSPGTKLPIIKSATNGKYLEKNIWGLKASWAKEEYKRLHNARLEGIDKKITFKKLIVNFRSVVPASGYYEWTKGENGKIPYYFTRTDDQDIFFASIYENGQYSIITREATKNISRIHHRQPVIINKSQINNFLNLNNDAVDFLNNLKPPELKYHEISKEINKPTINEPSLIRSL
ncbi:SOS response-associated peptidase [Pelagibacteraceae bacterium]|jgi:putative SOS response-associated peptidase YedK|nr:SOS response-associated peptidase [Pelagibacteraceae bacterium]